jgi:hypothetical protein
MLHLSSRVRLSSLLGAEPELQIVLQLLLALCMQLQVKKLKKR